MPLGMAHAQSVDLLFDDKTFKLDFDLYPEVMSTQQKQFITLGQDIKIPIVLADDQLLSSNPYIQTKTEFTPHMSPTVLKDILYESGLLLNRTPAFVSIDEPQDGEFVFSDKPASGYDVDFDALAVVIEQALADTTLPIRVPGKKRYTTIRVPQSLSDRGIQEVIAIGSSNFRGSSEKREQNIEAAARVFQGTIIPKGKTFSFNNTLEPKFSPDFGFQEELVIKGNELIPELGGGVCQVSTTAFRAAYTGGLPVTHRRPHSFAVPYYAPHGFDAMIYFGVSDLRFTNDTPGDILIQTAIEDDELFFIFYGTKDERQVTLEGPFIANYKTPKDAQVVESSELPFGEEIIVSRAYQGFDSKWIRTIESPTGEKQVDELKSYYRSFPAKILKGVGSSEGAFSIHQLNAERINQSEQEIR